MEIAEAMIKHIIRTVMEKCPQEMAFFNSFVDKGLLERLEHVASSDFGRVTYTEAVEILKKNNDKFDYKVEWGSDLQTEHERYLTEQIFKRPVFVTDYPKEIKAFYMRLNDDGKTVAATDCLVPGIGEIIGGKAAQRSLIGFIRTGRHVGVGHVHGVFHSLALGGGAGYTAQNLAAVHAGNRGLGCAGRERGLRRHGGLGYGCRRKRRGLTILSGIAINPVVRPLRDMHIVAGLIRRGRHRLGRACGLMLHHVPLLNK